MAFRCAGSRLLLQHQEVLMFPEALADAGPDLGLAWSVVLDGVADPANEAQGEGDDACQLGQGPSLALVGAGQFGADEAGHDHKGDGQNAKSRPKGGLLDFHDCCSSWNNPA